MPVPLSQLSTPGLLESLEIGEGGYLEGGCLDGGSSVFMMVKFSGFLKFSGVIFVFKFNPHC